MKKLLITLGLSAVATAGFAQGTVNVPNSASTLIHTNASATGGTIGNTAGTLGGFYYEVLTAPSTVTTVDASLQGLTAAGWSDTGLYGTNTGFVSGGHVSGPSGTGGVAANWPIGSHQSYIVIGWSAAEATTWTQMSAELTGATFSGGKWTGPALTAGGFLGVTVVANGTAGTAGGVGAYNLFGVVGAAGTPVTGPTDLFIVGTVPEPSTFALVGLGGAAMMIFRRRK